MFSQLYTISVIIQRTAVPVVYALLPGKSKLVYDRLFAALKEKLSNDWSPQRVMSDFEYAALLSVQESFPNAELTACLFHFGQSIYRRIQRLVLLNQAYNDFKWKLKSFQALSFVPLQFVYKYFCILVASFETNNEALTEEWKGS